MTSQTPATEPTRLADLLPTTLPESSPGGASAWTDEARAEARSVGIQRRIAAKWALDAKGVMSHGTGREKVEMRPTELMPSRIGEPDFDPHRDAFAVRLGAELEGPNRYRLGDLLLDANGACRDEGECPECGSEEMTYAADGSLKSGGDYRWRVYGADGEMTYCRRCVSQPELDAVRDRATEAAAKTVRGGRR